MKPNCAGFAKYLENPDLFAESTAEVADVGLYELVRNWVIGTELARRRQCSFALINLGGRSLETTVAEFSKQVAQEPWRRFAHRRWAEVLDAAAPLPSWLEGYALHQGLRG